mmetsp:Transcript_62489/g.161310  ORF Transcript_62489/g.161310 Transcript_62489/m.161310 type:complete len:378 (+) Transcript_62489:1-1134(+)
MGSGALSEMQAFEVKLDEDVVPKPWTRTLPLARKAGLVKLVCLILVWWSSAVLITLQLKSMLGHGGLFPFSILLTGLTNVTTGILTSIMLRISPRSSAPLPPLRWREVAVLTLLGAIQGFEFACSNKALESLSVSGRTMLGSVGPLFMMATSRFWGLEQMDAMRFMAALLATAGGALQGLSAKSSAGRSESDSYIRGIMLMTLAMTASAQRWALIQHVVQRSPTGSGLAAMSNSKLHLIQRTLPIAGVLCILFAIPFEMPKMSTDDVLQGALVCRVLGLGAGIVALTAAELELVRITSAMAMTIFAQLHAIPIAIAGALLFHESVSLGSVFGFCLCLVAACCYAKARHESVVTSSDPTVDRGLLESDEAAFLEARLA